MPHAFAPPESAQPEHGQSGHRPAEGSPSESRPPRPETSDPAPSEGPPAAKARAGRKLAQVLTGAREVFLRDGFEGASVDDIARVAGVSKATLYSYFPDKRLLFVEVATLECRRQAEEGVREINMTAAPAVVLPQIGRRIVDFVTSDFGMRVFRICVAEADRFPGIGLEFYRSGPAVVQARIADYLRECCARGELAIDDLDLAADQFAELCKASIHSRVVFGVGVACTQADASRTVDSAVEMFMARYGVKG